MDDTKKEKPEGEGDEVVQIPLSTITKLQEDFAKMELRDANREAELAGLKEAFANQAGTEGEPKLRVKKTFEPKFRTVRLRKYPIAGNPDNLGYIIGWTNRGAYQQVDRTGLTPQVVDFIDVIFLGQEKTETGKIKAEQIRLLDMFNQGIQVHCKIISQAKEIRNEPTGEEIDVATYDPQHGLISTGEKVDGYVTFSDVTYTIQIPGVEGTTVIDAAFVN